MTLILQPSSPPPPLLLLLFFHNTIRIFILISFIAAPWHCISIIRRSVLFCFVSYSHLSSMMVKALRCIVCDAFVLLMLCHTTCVFVSDVANV